MTTTIASDQAPAAIGPYVQAKKFGNMLITSGQLPINHETKAMPEDVAEQALQSLMNVKAIVEEAGLTVGNIVKTTVFVKDLNDFAKVNEVYGAFFDKECGAYPARSCVEVARLPMDAKVEIEAIAVAE
ncbi:RidA family protein [Photobacterium sanguinicancri]|uniref:RidA family protein n=1 Tax=Photobacterium sanguinicancri TaxID=875932 RepID=A0AAW7YDR7_9GAMM|nr:RidA family protein [Photobacterium sanguinicancri]KXI24039.1 reactive intermediate/imine deaminase [Photobacterium sanguinicancri]MDO6499327.1 RidA family protein [Photobacterium sanguinicancri]MDO6544968.1 RidA family protein [Photobacterium sanguinicancri]OZS41357.1 RidA family protein [Photobacterium sanguinicancri]